ncbi:MAG: beta-ketoacyl-ACP synthase II [Candidatus Omnitrophota bacterium]|nr:beta-ketoacyl-ACP synthase II [Candidatus Omnitrophota bacterium]
MPEQRVVITGLGVISPVGNKKEQFWGNIRKGSNGIGRITQLDPAPFDSKMAGEVKNFDPSEYISPKKAKRMARFVQFAVSSARMAIEDSSLELAKEDRCKIGVLIGSGIGSLYTIEKQHNRFLAKGPSKISPFTIPMLIVNMASGEVAISFGLKGPNFSIVTACASGTHAIGSAFKVVQRGDAEVMLAGGSESCITTIGLGAFCAMKALSTRNDQPAKASRPFDKDRDGFIIAEGAGMVILESLEHAKGRNAPIYAELSGYGMSSDAYHMTAPEPTGEGGSRAMNEALRDAKLKPRDISYINAHGTSTFLNDKVETLAVKKVFGEFSRKIPISSTKSMTGHLLGAAGAVEFIVCCLSIRDNIISPTINYENQDPDCDLDYVPNTARETEVKAVMSNSFGFGGHNAVLVVKEFNE